MWWLVILVRMIEIHIAKNLPWNHKDKEKKVTKKKNTKRHLSKWQISKCTEWQVLNMQYFNWWIPKCTIFQMSNFKCLIFQVATLNTLICPLWKSFHGKCFLELDETFYWKRIISDSQSQRYPLNIWTAQGDDRLFLMYVKKYFFLKTIY